MSQEPLPELWAKADLGERRRLMLAVLDTVYVELRDPTAAVTIRPKAVFEAVIMGGQALAELAPR